MTDPQYQLSARSRRRLSRVHPDLVKVIERAIEITPVDFCVLEGRRSIERQRKLYEAGATRTLKSRHLTGHAVDLGARVGGKLRWDWPLYGKIAQTVKRAARELKIPIEWGGDWRTFKDGPHFQLPRKRYADEWSLPKAA